MRSLLETGPLRCVLDREVLLGPAESGLDFGNLTGLLRLSLLPLTVDAFFSAPVLAPLFERADFPFSPLPAEPALALFLLLTVFCPLL